MNEQLIGLLEKLSTKLGVTIELLWGALTKQAFISGIIDLLTMGGLITLSVISFIFILKKTNPILSDEDNIFGAYIVWAVYSLFVIIFVSCNLTTSIAGIFNPDYWALKEILTIIK